MIVVTGASGKLGHHVVNQLLEHVPGREIAAVVRTPEKAKDLAARGVELREADYDRPETLKRAFAGADKLLLISASEVGRRAPQHANIIAAAKQAGVKLIVYTSILHADRSPLSLAREHEATEQAIRSSGVPYVFLRNGWYIENYTDNLAMTLEHGAILGAAGEGRVAAATRADFAAAAVKVLTSDGHEGKTYELAGDESFSLPELAAEIAEQAGKPIVYKDLPVAEYQALLQGFGLPEPFAAALADSDAHLAKGELDDDSHELSRLIGRPTTTLHDAVAAPLGR